MVDLRPFVQGKYICTIHVHFSGIVSIDATKTVALQICSNVSIDDYIVLFPCTMRLIRQLSYIKLSSAFPIHEIIRSALVRCSP